MFKKQKTVGWWWHTPLTPAFRRQKQEDLSEFEVSLVYRVSSRTARIVTQGNPVSKEKGGKIVVVDAFSSSRSRGKCTTMSSRPGWSREFQVSQGYIMRPCLWEGEGGRRRLERWLSG